MKPKPENGVKNFLFSTKEVIERDDISDVAIITLAYELARERTEKDLVNYSRFVRVLKGIAPDINFTQKSIERLNLFDFSISDDTLWMRIKPVSERTLTISASCWAAGATTANVKVFLATTFEQVGKWLQETAKNPFVSDGAVVRVHESDTKELLLRAVITNGKWQADDAAMPLARFLRPGIGHIAFIIETKSGYIPTIGKPVESEGDNDSWILVKEQHEKTSDLAEAQKAVRSCEGIVDDLYMQPGKSFMGWLWLSQFSKPEEKE